MNLGVAALEDEFLAMGSGTVCPILQNHTAMQCQINLT